MNPAMVDQIILWLMGGLGTGLGILIVAIGKWIVGEIEASREKADSENRSMRIEMSSMRQTVNEQLTSLRHDFARDMASTRERLAKVEGAVFPNRRNGDASS